MKAPKRSKTLPAALFAPSRPGPSFWEDLRAVLVPREKWHYLFHLLAVLSALAYWAGSRVLLPGASWAEIVMYRPRGDNQLWPVVTALSQLNFGDPTDVAAYGQGVGGFHAVILLPYALAYAVMGCPGYAVVDALSSLACLVAATLLFRRCRLGTLPSLILACALATGGLQMLSQKAGQPLAALLQVFNLPMADWSFPNLAGLPLFERRVPRPLFTDIFAALLLYFFARQWQEHRSPGLGRGVAVGALMGLLVQGDPYLFSVMGLMLAVSTLVAFSNCGRVVPWRYLLGMGPGFTVTCAYFFYQLAAQSPESAVRFGLAAYSRSTLWVLPGYAAELRVAVVCLFAGAVLLAARKAGPAPATADPEQDAAADAQAVSGREFSRRTAWFCVMLVCAGWLAQPAQLFLLGKGAQIYHYAFYTLPMCYAFAMLLLLGQLIRLSLPRQAWPVFAVLARRPGWAGGAILSVLVVLLGLLALEEPLAAITSKRTSRVENSPWAVFGDQYRPAFRDLDKAFRDQPALRQARSFGTFCHEVNFLLTAFHGKRAFLPDNGFTTLSDEALERRVCDMGRIFAFPVAEFARFIQDTMTMNYWLGCARYWCASDHKFASERDYPEQVLAQVKAMPRQSPFNLVLPLSELRRLLEKYELRGAQPAQVESYPDLIITTALLKTQAIAPRPDLYREVYTNIGFTVYGKVR